ncbi:hypothetical protein GCM10008094_14140 [Aidingimonas halophila]|nr:hypothetical protein GCM10008094_14140 [Aidingimonas halophila]
MHTTLSTTVCADDKGVVSTVNTMKTPINKYIGANITWLSVSDKPCDWLTQASLTQMTPAIDW